MSASQFLFPNLNARTLLRGGVALLMAVSLAACGGDDDNDAPDEPMELSGLIDTLTSQTDFVVQGVPVDASNATNKAGTLTVGKAVEIDGRLENGVFIAKRIETENDSDFDGLEIWGRIESLDTTAKTFVLRGVTVNYGAPLTVVFEDGVESDLANNVRVEVEGQINADGVSVDAARIDFED